MLSTMRMPGYDPPPTALSCEYHWGHPRMGVGLEHRHDVHEFVLVAQGRYRVRIAGQVWSGGVGDGFLYPAGGIHHPLPDRVRSSRFYLLRWAGGPIWFGQDPSVHRDTDRRLMILLDWLVAETASGQHEPSPLALGLWWSVLAILRRGPAAPAAPQPESPIDRLRRIIADIPANPLSLTELADLVGLSPSQLIRRCRAETGQTPMRLLRRERIGRVARLLASGEEPLAAIARQVGLADAVHLSHLFRAERGEAPGTFRRRVRRRW
jgi:AraC-like DNA-binding protein